MASTSEEMKSQDSDGMDQEYDDDMDEDEDEDIDNYYDEQEGDDTEMVKDKTDDPEYYEFELLKVEDVERLLNESVEKLCQSLQISPSLAKMTLHRLKWQADEIIYRHHQNADKLLIDCNIMPAVKPSDPKMVGRASTCPVCLQHCESTLMYGLACGHCFCRDCWQMHFQVQIFGGTTTTLECMARECKILVPEDFVQNLVSNPKVRDKYQQYTFLDYVKSHPELRFCPGPNCHVIVRSPVPRAKRVYCSECKTTYCFKCGIEYHAPTDCETIKKWLTKCADDSETANYISAHTKDCPKCHVCIEKNGGCNHMQCTKCKHDFCWMCCADWKTHGSEYYECSRYKENPNIANESVNAQAREALKKYLFYFERYENHAKSLKLEEQTLRKIRERIQEKVMKSSGTWIDWQYLLDAAALLRKCRYTLQYTYPYAYYLEKGPRKQLFEYQQAQLEAEVENLSWKVERAEILDRGDLENQMDIAEKRRLTLVRDFLTE